MPLGPNKDLVLRYITFRDSPYETPPAIEVLETDGKKGYAILLEGVKSGSAKVFSSFQYCLSKSSKSYSFGTLVFILICLSSVLQQLLLDKCF